MPFLSEISILEVSLLNVWCARMFSELRGILRGLIWTAVSFYACASFYWPQVNWQKWYR